MAQRNCIKVIAVKVYRNLTSMSHTELSVSMSNSNRAFCELKKLKKPYVSRGATSPFVAFLSERVCVEYAASPYLWGAGGVMSMTGVAAAMIGQKYMVQ